MLGGYLRVPKAETLLFNPPNPPSDQVLSYKGTPPLALIDQKGSAVTNIALPI